MATRLREYDVPKAVQDIDLHLAISLLILKRELEEAGVYTTSDSDPNSLTSMLDCITNVKNIPSRKNWQTEIVSNITPEIMCKSGRIAPAFLRNIQVIIEMKDKYVDEGKIKPYTASRPVRESVQEDLENVIAQLKRSGSTVMSSDYFWDPEMIARLPEALKEIEKAIGCKVKLHDPLAPAEPITHREKQKYVDSQLWVYTQIVPMIVISIEK